MQTNTNRKQNERGPWITPLNRMTLDELDSLSLIYPDEVGKELVKRLQDDKIEEKT